LSSIRFKLSLAFGAALAMVAGIGLFSLVQLNAVNSVTREIREVWLDKLDRVSALQSTLTSHDLMAARRLQSLNFRDLAAAGEQIAALEQRFAAQLAGYGDAIGIEAEGAHFKKLQADWDAYRMSFAGVVELLNSGGVGARERFEADTRPAFAATMADLEEFRTRAEAQTAAAEARAQEVLDRARSLLALLTICSLLAALAAVVWVSMTISSPLLRVSRAMQRLTEGDDTVVIESEERSDEIGTLVAAAAGYRGSVIRARELADIAETDKRRLQAAIANMPIGFCMYDDNDQLIVSNQKFAEIYKLSAEATRQGTPHAVVVAERLRQGTYNGSDPDAYVEKLKAVRTAGEPHAAIWDLSDGRTISTIFQPMNGGWLSTHEDISDRRRSEARIAHMARHDALTDLPNRILFRERVDAALKQLPADRQLAVLGLDLDRFKSVNDTLGHPVGDQLLRAVAERLRSSVREGDTVSRFGGDEFAVVQVDLHQPAAARALAQRLIDALSDPFDIDGHQIAIGASVGIALAPADGNAAEELLKNADMALYRSKAEGRGVFRFFEPEMDARMQARRRLELDLRRGLAAHEFLIYYQPVIDLESNSVTSFEALLRWKHPERGLILPGEFIPLAEEIGLIVPLGEWILRQACTDAVSWPENIKVAVNLSPVQFRSKRLTEAVMSALAVSKLQPNRLELEITEGVLLADNQETLATLHRLRALGVHISMDDFGTGYSSLSYLQSFPFDKIKIDASFIRRMSGDESSMAIIRAVTGLGASLGMKTTAEGVETAQQLEWVRAEGCTEVQGFLFSRAVPAQELRALISAIGATDAAVA
jgi:diguanylate cyclase (GGDEF)-like protein